MQLKKTLSSWVLLMYIAAAWSFPNAALSQNPAASAVNENQIAGFSKNLISAGPGISAMEKTSSDCEDPGTEEGWAKCVKNYSNGFKEEIVNYQESFGSQFKRQTQITELNRRGEAVNVKTVRLKTSFDEDGRQKKAEYFDVVNRPQKGKITREVILYRYDPETQKRSYVSWTLYEQIGSEMFAQIQQHVVLNYDSDGNPLKGRAERWENQHPVEDLFKRDDWQKWENEILSASPNNLF